MVKRFLLYGVALSLSACAVTPLAELPATHPASPNGSASPIRPRTALTVDDSTRITQQLLSQGPSPSAPDSTMSDKSNMPEMHH